MQLKWSSQRAIANSRVVRTSAIWLLVVPIAAKFLSSLDDKIDMTVFGGTLSFTTALPFSWQLLFFSAIFFTIAGIIYSVFCPELVKTYENFTQFRTDGKSRLQINAAFKALVWDSSKDEVKVHYFDSTREYLSQYSGKPNPSYDDLERLGYGIYKEDIFEDISSKKGEDSNAFYFVHELSDKHSQGFILASLVFYIAGFACIGIIAVQNIGYVINTFG